ncbi:hypothetical protein DDN99_17935 [Vibrio cholerae]|nr:hypothetical protein [Vibrio cholerae]EGR4159119.1 hypothetical protein [Vibrio cholerae]
MNICVKESTIISTIFSLSSSDKLFHKLKSQLKKTRILSNIIHPFCILKDKHNARLRGWQRITLNSNTTAITTAAHWDWKRHALAVPLRRLLGRTFITP